MDWKAGFDNAFSDVLTKRNLLLLALFWITTFLVAVTYGTLSGRADVARGCPMDDAPRLAGNETGTFGAWRESAGGGGQAAYKVTFDNLRAEHGTLGIFKTASHKVVHIGNLDVTFRRSSAGDAGSLQDFCDLFAPRRGGALKAKPLGILHDVESEAADWSVRVDVSNTTEVRVRDLDWKICCGPRTVLRVSCKYAQLQAGSSQVVLRGQATVTTPDARLQSNHIEINVPDECFVVDGRYVLTQRARTRTGSGACFDKTLRRLSVERSEGREDEEWVSGLPFGAL